MPRTSLVAGLSLFVMLVVAYQVNGYANLASEVTLAFTSAVDLLRQFCSRALVSMSINADHAVKAFTRASALDPLRTYSRDYLKFLHEVITRLIEERTIFLPSEKQLRPQPSRENRSYSFEDPFYHCEREPPVSLFGDNGLPANFNQHAWHTVLLVQSIVYSALLAFYYGALVGALCLAPWRYACGQISALPRRLAAKPTATWETVSENLMSALLNVMSALAKLFAVASEWFLIFTKGLAFCTECFKLYAAGLDLGFIKRPDPEVREIFKFILDPRAPILEEKLQKSEAEREEIRETLHEVCRQRALHNKVFYENEEKAGNRNVNQRGIIRNYAIMHDKIGLTKPIYEQVVENERLLHVAEETVKRTVQEKDATEKACHEKIDEKDAKIRELTKAKRAEKEEHAKTKASYMFLQDRATHNEQASRAKDIKIKSQKGQVQNLENLRASDKKAYDLRVNSLEAQVKDRDELVGSQKQAMEAMKAQAKEQEQRHSSQLKSQLASHKRGSDRQVKTWAKACQHNNARREDAEKKLKTADEARKTADEARETAERTLKAEKDARKASEEESAAKIKAAEEAREIAERAHKAEEDARKTAEAESAANLKALKAEEDAREAADENRKAAELALKSAVDARKAAEDESAANLTALKAEEAARKTAEEKLEAAEIARKAAEEEAASLRERLDDITPPSPRKMPPGSPSTTPPGSPARSPSPSPPGSPGRSPSPSPPGSPVRSPSPQPFGAPSPPRRGKLPKPPGSPSKRPMARMGRSLRPREPQSNPPANPGPSQPPIFPMFNFASGSTPNITGSGPSAPPAGPSMPPSAP